MLKELTAVISDDNTNIRGVDIRQDENGEAIVEFVVEAEDLHHLNRMVLGLRRVAGVRAVQRMHRTVLLSSAASTSSTEAWPRSLSTRAQVSMVPYGPRMFSRTRRRR
jgi:nitrate reductase NapAB chaperone NapD